MFKMNLSEMQRQQSINALKMSFIKNSICSKLLFKKLLEGSLQVVNQGAVKEYSDLGQDILSFLFFICNNTINTTEFRQSLSFN
jgi:hypothetical protein